ncbi:MAG: hypothetical protein HPY85_17260 [Anaerolineae bacterium]|nr:hypothetical protein [Anaerolineae bacterium]
MSHHKKVQGWIISAIFVVFLAGLALLAEWNGTPLYRILYERFFFQPMELPPLPDIPPLRIPHNGWEDVKVDQVCLQSNLSFPRNNEFEKPEVMMKRVLEEMGFQVVSSDCDFTLAVNATGEALSGSYQNIGGIKKAQTCHTGGEILGEMAVTATGHPTIEVAIFQRKEPPAMISGNTCPDQNASPVGSMMHVAVLENLRKLFGAKALWAELQVVDSSGSDLFSESFVLRSEGAIEFLIEKLMTGDDNEKWNADLVLSHLGPAAIEAVPYLIYLYETEHWDNGTLRNITLMNLSGEDPKAWSKWWKTVSPQITALLEQRNSPVDLLQAFKSDDGFIQNVAAALLMQLGPDAIDVMPEIISRLESPDDSPYAIPSPAAVRILGTIGPDAIEAVPVIIDQLDHYLENDYTLSAQKAHYALQSITGEHFSTLSEWQEWWGNQ